MSHNPAQNQTVGSSKKTLEVCSSQRSGRFYDSTIPECLARHLEGLGEPTEQVGRTDRGANARFPCVPKLLGLPGHVKNSLFHRGFAVFKTV